MWHINFQRISIVSVRNNDQHDYEYEWCMGKYQGRVSALRISFPLNETLLHRKRTDLKIDMGNIQNDWYHIVSKGLKDYIRFEKQLEEFSVGQFELQQE